MRHDDIWRAIETLAAEHGLSPSGLARKAGLDPTSFNISKRRTPDGKFRWPSTESLAKILQATGARLEDFTALVTGARTLPDARPKGRNKIPLIGMAQAGAEGFFDDGGYPAGAGWDEVELPTTADDPREGPRPSMGVSQGYEKGPHQVFETPGRPLFITLFSADPTARPLAGSRGRAPGLTFPLLPRSPDGIAQSSDVGEDGGDVGRG
jgi:hypothetical protein